MIKVVPIILCGGSGTRLWPLSRNGFPKQFLALSGTNSLFQQTIERANKIGTNMIECAKPIIVTNEEHRFLAVEQLRELKIEADFLLEPIGRNTAPALTLASMMVKDHYSEDVMMVVMPSDQTIMDEEKWIESIRQSIQQASEGGIVTLGIMPTHPETGYGYIKKHQEKNQNNASEVTQFTEKPNLDVAKGYVDSKHYLWNSGIFILQAGIWLQAIEQFCPEILKQTYQAWVGKSIDHGGFVDFVRPNKEDFLKIQSDSIDYAVIEKCPGKLPIFVVPLDAGWSDLGAWDAVWNVGHKDTYQNVIHGDVLLHDTYNSYIHATCKLVGVVGLKDIVVIETADAVLVADKNNSQAVKKIVEQLEKNKREEKNLHRKVHRPWGWYDSIDEGERFKVKRIQVKPKASLSLQMHHHRAEHWIVVKGTAEITNGDQVITLSENQSTYIPLGQKHRLSNPGTIPLEIIEVQSGSYLGEDDIVRFEDTFGRS
jgi:mannose-1-phosphate guanylyltransferase / mannose-6-phosphate isomerase